MPSDFLPASTTTPAVNDLALKRFEQKATALAGTKVPTSLDKEKAKLKEAAQEFEAIFTQQLLEAMDKTIERDAEGFLNGGSAEETFRSMMYENIARTISHGPASKGFSGGLGLAKHIYEQAVLALPKEPSTSQNH